jgi:hypothetical protein
VIIRDIKTIFNAGSAFLAYFYFDFKDTEKQSFRALLTSLLVQLSDQSDIFRRDLLALYLTHEQGSEQPTNDSLSECLKHMLILYNIKDEVAWKSLDIFLLTHTRRRCHSSSHSLGDALIPRLILPRMISDNRSIELVLAPLRICWIVHVPCK